MYLIGEFAAINKISTRMLRHYDSIGLIKPIEVKENGYRYYSENQIEAISKIKKLLECKFSLKEINIILKANDMEILKSYAKNKINEISELSNNCEDIIRYLEGIVSDKDERESVYDNYYEISITNKKQVEILSYNNYISEIDIENAFNKIYKYIDIKNIFPKGCSIMINYMDYPKDKHYKIGVSVNELIESDEYSYIKIDEGKYISTIHYGDYNEIGYAYNAIIKYADENKYNISKVFMERYLLDNYHAYSRNEYITEVLVAIIDTP